jgi:SAM-dependent MidA family methyltransferase
VTLHLDLSSFIRARIEKEGPITIREFLTQLTKLQNEHLSYEQTPVDYSILEEIISDWCINFWEENGKPKNLKIILFSPKKLELIAKLFDQLSNKAFAKSIHIYIVEPNSYFTKFQQDNLKSYLNNITWVDGFEKIQIDSVSIIIANKFFSSLPIDQYTRKKGEWLTNVVDLSPGKQHFCITHASLLNDNLQEYLNSKYPNIHEGGIVELHDEAAKLLKKIIDDIKKSGGCILLLDYGYLEHTKRNFLSTLQATNNRRWTPIFHRLGRNFVSAHLNFSNIKNIIELQGAQAHGPIPQGSFLTNMNISEKRERLERDLPPHKHSNLMKEYEKLTSPKQWGDLFKAMSIYTEQIKIAGFTEV